jgi:glutaredoxin
MFRVFSKTNCGYCTKAKSLLEESGEHYEVIEEFDVEAIKRVTNHKTFPFIFKDNTFLGGFTELSKYLDGEDIFEF